MIIVELNGGLGNQMFQYAFGKVLSLKYAKDLYVDVSHLDPTGKEALTSIPTRGYEMNIFTAQIKHASAELVSSFDKAGIGKALLKSLKLPYKKTLIEGLYMEGIEISSIVPPVLLRGYWQSESYFYGYEDQIRKEFVFKNEIINFQDKTLEGLIGKHRSVGVHIRRGDYVTNPIANRVLGVLDVNYYLSAMELIGSKVDDPYFIIFSDDPVWVKDHLPKPPRYVVVEGGLTKPTFVDMYLMSRCDHNIIANSTYSWWAAWLNENKGKIVVAPRRWFKDRAYKGHGLIPLDWLSI